MNMSGYLAWSSCSQGERHVGQKVEKLIAARASHACLPLFLIEWGHANSFIAPGQHLTTVRHTPGFTLANTEKGFRLVMAGSYPLPPLGVLTIITGRVD